MPLQVEMFIEVSSKSSTVDTLWNCIDCQPASYSLKIRLPDETEIDSSVGPPNRFPYPATLANNSPNPRTCRIV